MSFETSIAKRVALQAANKRTRDSGSVRRTWAWTARLCFLIALVFVFSSLAPLARADSEASIWTDKPNYQPEETVTIFGVGFLADATVSMSVTRPDGEVDSWVATSNDTGGFTTTYQLDGIIGNYTVDATDGSNSATMTFRDAPPQVNLDQCRNGPADTPNDCEDSGGGQGWVNGNAGASQSHYVEGYSIPYRAVMTDLPTGTSITLTLGYDIKHSGAHAIDYLTHYQRLEPHLAFGHSAETVYPKDGVSGVSGTTTTWAIPAPSSTSPCTSPVSGQPTTSFTSLPASERLMTLFGGTITGMAYVSQGCLTDAQAETLISITFTVSSATAVLSWGGHIARSLDWGSGHAAGGISGSPYHMRVDGWTLGNLGSQDRSLSAEAVLAAGKVIIEKVAVGGDATFSYAATGSGLDASFTISTSGGAGTKTFSDIPAGSKSVTEGSLPTGWSFTSLSCSDPDSGTTTSGMTASIDLDPGETVTCTYTNTNSGNIVIVKNTVGGDGTFSFSTTGGDGLPASFSITTSGGTNSQSYSVAPGTYSVSETVPSGWKLASSTCSSGTPGGFTVSAGATVTCTFTNKKLGTIVIVKNTVGGDGTFSFSTTGGDGLPASFSITTDAGTGSQTYTDIDPDNAYSVSETVPPGWDLTASSCSSGAPASFTVAPGGTVTCTFTNTKRGTVVVKKVTVPAGGTDFTFTGDASGTIDDGESITVSDLVPGTYTSTESDPTPAFDLTSISCDDGSSATPSTWNVGTRTATILLDPGETVTCTFTNTQRGTIVVEKVTVGGDGSFEFDPSWEDDFLLSNGGSHPSGFLVPGTYSVAELPQTGWDLTDVYCSDGSDPSSISLQPGETVTCTFTNTKRGTIIVAKHAVGGNGEFFFAGSFGDFSITTSSGAGSETFDNLVPGTFSVSETDPTPEWDLTAATCDDGSDPGSIGLSAGETVTCTFTNTKRGTIIIQKETVGGDDEFGFTGDLGPFSITTDSNYGDETFNNVVPGAYGVSETSPAPEWDLTGLSCVDSDGSGTNSEWDLVSGTATILLDPGETVTCTFTNTQRGTIVVEKVTIGGDGSFEFDPSWEDDFLLSNGGSHPSGFLVPGTYTVSEVNVPDGWDLTSATCSDGSDPSSISLQPGETVTCTFTNTKRGTITVTKYTDPSEDPQVFTFETTGAGYAGFSLTDGQSDDSGYLVPGTYTVTEGFLANWDLTVLDCSDPTAGTTEDLANRKATIGLDPGDDVSCKFTNTQRGTIVVEKVTVGGDGSFEFDPSWEDDFLLSDGGSRDSGYLVPGSYSVEELSMTGWDLTVLGCGRTTTGSGTSSWTLSLGTRTASILLGAGDTVTCTFTNTARGHLIIEKFTDPAGDAQSFHFVVTGPYSYADAFDLTDGQSDNSGFIRPGTYTVLEDGLEGWDLTGATCDNGDIPASVSVGPGQTVTCTFTNTKRGHIIVDKVTLPGGEAQSFPFSLGSFDPFFDQGFSLSDAATPHDSGAILPVEYDLVEGVVTGWDLMTLTCEITDPGSGTSTWTIVGRAAHIDLQPGDTVTCTYTNAKRGQIIVQKYSFGGTGTFEFTLSGVTGGDPSPTSIGTSVTTAGTPGYGDHTFGNLIATGTQDQGTYGLEETTPAGWTLMDASCSDGSPVDAIDLAPGETVVCTFNNIVKNLVTDSALCTFDRDTSVAGSQFRLLFTQDPQSPSYYKATATNPGQFYYNVFVLATGTVSLHLTIPYPFVTQGAQPIHAYDSATVSTVGTSECITPGTEIFHDDQQITLGSYSGGFGSTKTIDLEFEATGFTYVNIHLDYGLKGTGGWTKGSSNQAIGSGAYTGTTIYDLGTYAFSYAHDGDGSDSQSVQNENSFKKNPGFGGQVYDGGTFNGIPGVTVTIFRPDWSTLGTATTDSDGYYFYSYKHTGKAATFHVSAEGQTIDVLVKANSFVWADFEV